MNFKTNLMQEALNVQIDKTIIFVLLFSFISLVGFSQKTQIKAEEDYTLLNKSLIKYFEVKHFSDSLFFNSEFYLKNANHKKTIRDVKFRKSLDTIFLKAIADKLLYRRFLEEDAKWKREKRYNKFSAFLDQVFSKDEVEHYKKQIEDNFYLWNEDKIGFSDYVFVEEDFELTREELKSLNKKTTTFELEYQSKSKKFVRHRLFTFSKPIYSRDHKIALISYNYGGNNLLYMYKKVNNQWFFKLAISENWFIDHID